MPGFELVPVAGGEPIRLPEGETVLGRGPLLGVSDMRVSRRHGLLENLDGRLRLKPIHVNPCFSQSSLDASPEALQRDSWYTLRDGDLFSLLPGRCVYKVAAVGGGDGPLSVSGDPTTNSSGWVLICQAFQIGQTFAFSLPDPIVPMLHLCLKVRSKGLERTLKQM
uniref:PNK FHA domain-containing protein n=1 Tax=Myripristis murdjan TaxID=586833 RepID=A0A667ZP53_9TELE